MNEQICQVRPATPSDSHAVWNVRFNLDVAATALTNELVPFDKHDEWFQKKYFGEVKNYCWVLVCDQEVCGYCRCDVDASLAYVVSIALNPNWHGQGLGKKLLLEVLVQLPSGLKLKAEVKNNNVVSVNLFKAHGFIQIETTPDTFVLTRQL
ncbi:MAG: GNAT family N-acetyltransferase [Candidatus Magasanikbacteria bacterium]|nr:GNAT family N-acetyltransferase [Candidatus Magasanikbacteria bacterium]